MLTYVIIAAGVWVVSIAAWFFVSKRFRSADTRRSKDRVLGKPKPVKAKAGSKAGPLLATEDRTTGRLVLRLLEKYKLTAKLERMLEQSGVRWKVARLVHASLGMFLVGFFVGWQMLPGNKLLINLGIGIALGSFPILFVARKRKKRLHAFEEQFPESLEFIARSMRAGHAFSVSLEMIHKEFQEPLAGEFRRTFEEHNLGLPLEMALQKLAGRVPSLDVHFFVSAVLLQKRTGGNLAEILDKLAYLIRERFKLRGKIRAISAHGKMTGTALSSIPIAVGLLMFWVNREYVTFFFDDETGNYMAGAAIGLQLVGYAIIRKIVAIEV